MPLKVIPSKLALKAKEVLEPEPITASGAVWTEEGPYVHPDAINRRNKAGMPSLRERGLLPVLILDAREVLKADAAGRLVARGFKERIPSGIDGRLFILEVQDKAFPGKQIGQSVALWNDGVVTLTTANDNLIAHIETDDQKQIVKNEVHDVPPPVLTAEEQLLVDLAEQEEEKAKEEAKRKAPDFSIKPPQRF